MVWLSYLENHSPEDSLQLDQIVSSNHSLLALTFPPLLLLSNKDGYYSRMGTKAHLPKFHREDFEG